MKTSWKWLGLIVLLAVGYLAFVHAGSDQPGGRASGKSVAPATVTEPAAADAVEELSPVDTSPEGQDHRRGDTARAASALGTENERALQRLVRLRAVAEAMLRSGELQVNNSTVGDIPVTRFGHRNADGTWSDDEGDFREVNEFNDYTQIARTVMTRVSDSLGAFTTSRDPRDGVATLRTLREAQSVMTRAAVPPLLTGAHQDLIAGLGLTAQGVTSTLNGLTGGGDLSLAEQYLSEGSSRVEKAGIFIQEIHDRMKMKVVESGR